LKYSSYQDFGSSKSRILTLRVSIIIPCFIIIYSIRLTSFSRPSLMWRVWKCIFRSLLVAVMKIKLWFYFSHSPLWHILKIDRRECDCDCSERMSFKLCCVSIGLNLPSKHVQHKLFNNDSSRFRRIIKLSYVEYYYFGIYYILIELNLKLFVIYRF